MKRTIITIAALLALVSTTGCDQAAIIEAGSCALDSETLSVAFSHPGRAKAHLRGIAKGLEDKDPKAAGEAGELIGSLLECMP